MCADWKNPYIDKVTELPECIVPAESTCISKEHANRLRQIVELRERTYIEIGSGSGGHLIERALRDPDASYIGFELRYKRAYRTAEKAARHGLSNLYVARTTAALTPEIFRPASISGIYVNFPDPWDKKKWKKHRLLNPVFIEQIHSLLQPGGFLSYKTDHQSYFEETEQLLQTSALFSVTECSRDLHRSEFASENVRTEFENLFISKGLPTYFLKAVRQ